MALRLKEDPREWRKFAAVGALFVVVVAFVAQRRGGLSPVAFAAVGVVAIVSCGVGWLRPRWIRPLYRGAMTASHWIGQCVGQVLLAIFFLMLLTPLGLVLRLFGMDPLGIRKPLRRDSSYWHPARAETSLDKLF